MIAQNTKWPNKNRIKIDGPDYTASKQRPESGFCEELEFYKRGNAFQAQKLLFRQSSYFAMEAFMFSTEWSLTVASYFMRSSHNVHTTGEWEGPYYITQPSAYGFNGMQITGESSYIRRLFKEDVTIEWEGNNQEWSKGKDLNGRCRTRIHDRIKVGSKDWGK